MLFDSIEFAVFLPIAFLLYWLSVRISVKSQNLIVVLSSYVFYGWWNPKFLFLILFSSITDYLLGILLSKTDQQNRRRLLLYLSIAINIGILGFFKYYNFFLNSFIESFTFFGATLEAEYLDIVLPVGISFYTFQTLSYTVDIYRRKMQATTDILAFLSFVSFFPQLVAGPIEKAKDLLPQFLVSRRFDYVEAVDGCRQALWGLFKKAVIADNCAHLVNMVFTEPSSHSGSTLLFGMVFFSFQIYCDFSGYSDIAIGISRLFGIRLTQNFNFPYFSRSLTEFWRRWHLSISRWFTDYIYRPLGGSRTSKPKILRNVFAVFLLSGLWHGANWTFIVWSLLCVILIIPSMFTGSNRRYLDTVAQGKHLPSLKECWLMISTFSINIFLGIFFRAPSIAVAFDYIASLLTPDIFSIPNFGGHLGAVRTLTLISFMMTVEWFGREGKHALDNLTTSISRPVRWIFYSFIIFLIGMYMSTDSIDFYYFQF